MNKCKQCGQPIPSEWELCAVCEPEPPVVGSATGSASIYEAIDRLLTLAGIANPPGWELGDQCVTHKLDEARETFERLYVRGYAVSVLKDANHMCRSAMEIAKRDGKDTNWETFRARLQESLLRQHAAMYPPNERGERPDETE